MTFDVAILAGGKGTRLRDRTGTLPKVMVSIAGKPLLEHQIELCARHEFRRILLLVHYEHGTIRAHFGDGARHGVAIGYHVEETPRGTAGALGDALTQLDSTFLVLYGDTYLDVNLRALWDAHAARRPHATLFVHPSDHPADSDLVEVDADGYVTSLHAHPHGGEQHLRNLANAALYVLDAPALEAAVPQTDIADLARDVFPVMLRAGRRLFAYSSPEYVKDVGTPERLDLVARDIATGLPERLSDRQPRSAVFLDRDGTLNIEVNYLRHHGQLELCRGAAAAVGRLNRAGRLAVVITNQAVVARGEVSLDELARIHARLDELLGAEGAYLDATYVCPHHPDRGFPGEVAALKIACACRKPQTGSIDAACRDLGIDRNTSWMIGDTTSDVETGRRAGLKTIVVRTGHAGQDGKYPFRPDYVAADLDAAVEWIVAGHPQMSRRLAPVAVASLAARLVLVGGLARAGKSTVAQVLKELMTAMGRTAHVLPLDSWLKPAGSRTEGTGVRDRFDLDAASAVVRPMIGGRDRHVLDLPAYDRARRARLAGRLHFSIGPDDLLIVEGVPALLADDVAALADVRVYVDVPEPERVARLRADYAWRGEADDAVDALLASRAQDESRIVEETRGRADFVVGAWTER